MRRQDFFEEQSENSELKSQLVTKYFDSWSNLMLREMKRPTDRLAYVDLFCRPGRYLDGSHSTPLKILDFALASPRLCQHLVASFNDKNAEYCAQLQHSIHELPGIQNLSHPPVVTNEVIGRDLVSRLRSVRLVPTLFFIDPFGYTGLSLDLIANAIRSWGCYCIFFFNYNRIRPGLENVGVDE